MYSENGKTVPVKSEAFSAYSSPKPGKQSTWIVDSGAPSQMTPNEALGNYVYFDKPEMITIGDVTWIEALGEGEIPFKTKNVTGTLTNVLWIPGLKTNLFSVGKAIELDRAVEFNHQSAQVNFFRDEQIVLSGAKKIGSNYFIIEMMPNNECTKFE